MVRLSVVSGNESRISHRRKGRLGNCARYIDHHWSIDDCTVGESTGTAVDRGSTCGVRELDDDANVVADGFDRISVGRLDCVCRVDVSDGHATAVTTLANPPFERLFGPYRC